MLVGFFTVFRKDPQHYVLAEILVRSVRVAMPDVEIVQLTDERSPQVHGTDAVQRLAPGPMLERRIEHYAACEGEWLLLDTDVVVRRDVRFLFEDAFDVAICDREWPHLAATPDLTREMPFNTGVCFSRSPAFWAAVLETWRGFPPEQQGSWMSEQQAVAQVVQSARFHVAVLPGSVYNYPPAVPGADGGAAICHYKGARKDWMRQLTIAPRVLTCA